MATYRIHPGIGVARLGNSESEFYLAPETPAAMPQACDSFGNPLVGPDGVTPVPVKTFKDSEGRVKRQAARFQIFVYDEFAKEGRPLAIGDQIEGGGNRGALIDIQWRVYVANKKASWYPFKERTGEPIGHYRTGVGCTSPPNTSPAVKDQSPASFSPSATPTTLT